MNYTALYRKFRPDSYEDVKGQDHIVKTLKNQLRAGRIGHAYLFCGTRGTGKTTVAKILARAVNCENPKDGNPCNECVTCRSIRDGSFLNVVEIDAASNNGVDNIREIREEIDYRPTNGKYRVYIIDEVHMLSPSAFNALLKTLEEPPEYVIFILATTEVQKIPATILSRCQRYDFHRIPLDVITARLNELLAEEGIEAEEKAVRYVARLGDGSMRDALSLLDRCIAFYLNERLTYEKILDILGAVDTETYSRMLREILAGRTAAVIGILEELTVSGRELGQFVGDFTWYLRNLLLIKTSEHPEEVVDVSEENLRLMQEEGKMIDMEILMRYIRILSDAASQLKASAQKRILVETALIRMCCPAMQTDQTALLDRIRVLERELEELKTRPVVPLTDYRDGTQLHSGEIASQPEEETTVPLAKAPEELQKILDSWHSVVQTTTHSLRSVLKEARPAFNQKQSDGVLYILLEDTVFSVYHADNPQSIDEIREAIRKTTGMEADIRLVLSKNAPQGMAVVSLEEAIRNEIAFPVEVEDE